MKYAKIEQMTIPKEPVKFAMTPIHERPLWNWFSKWYLEQGYTDQVLEFEKTNLGPRISIEYEINAPKAISEANIIRNWLQKVSNQSEFVLINLPIRLRS